MINIEKDDFTFYSYGLKEININKENNNIYDINFGKFKFPLNVFKKDMVEFIETIISEEERDMFDLSSDKINNLIEKDSLEVLNKFIVGRSITLITTFRNPSEYINVGQNKIKYISSLNLDGKFERVFDYENKKPKYEDLYPNDSKIDTSRIHIYVKKDNI